MRRATTSGFEPDNKNIFISNRRGSAVYHPDKKSRTKHWPNCGEESPLGPSISFCNSPSILSEEKKRKVASRIMNITSHSSPARITFDSPMSVKSTRSEGVASSGKEDGYVTAHENMEGSAEKNIDPHSYHNFCITKSNFWRRSSGASSGSPEMNKIMRPRMRSISADPYGNFDKKSLKLPSSPPETPLVARQKLEIESYIKEVTALKRAVSTRHSEIRGLKEALHASEEARKELDNRRQMAQEEVETCNFINSLQDQRCGELEEQISCDRFDRHEIISNKSRRHKATIKKLQQERAEYESRANLMIQQMTEQMSQLQKMAMTRIETLESELMNQRHATEKWQTECSRLQGLLNVVNNNAANTKNRKSVDDTALPLSSPPNQGFRRVRRGDRCSSTNSSYGGRSRASTCSSRSSCTVVQDDCLVDDNNSDGYRDDDEMTEGADSDRESNENMDVIISNTTTANTQGTISLKPHSSIVNKQSNGESAIIEKKSEGMQIEAEVWNAYI